MNTGSAAAVLLELGVCSGMHVGSVSLFTASWRQGEANSPRTGSRSRRTCVTYTGIRSVPRRTSWDPNAV